MSPVYQMASLKALERRQKLGFVDSSLPKVIFGVYGRKDPAIFTLILNTNNVVWFIINLVFRTKSGRKHQL